jgi:hypothetical protein
MATTLHAWTDGQREQMNGSVDQYLWVFVNHLLDDWVQRLPLAEFGVMNGVSEVMKCTPFFTIQGTHPQMSFAGQLSME